MELFVIRHTVAAEGDDDRQRPLTGRGKRQARAVAAALRHLKLSVGAIWQSGLVRARQTAQLIAPAIQSDQGIVEMAGLLPDDKPGPIATAIEQYGHSLMIVGHEPLLGKLISRLLTGSVSANLVKMRKGTVACLSRNAGGLWQLQWLLTPKLAGLSR